MQLNRSPSFLPGGDMKGFTVNENTKVGTEVYQLKGTDPDGKKIFYYISGDTFSVNKDTGVVTLIRELDREKEASLDVIITIIDEKIGNDPSNTISVRREIKIADFNDNYPVFEGAPYKFSISESTKLFTTVYEEIFVKDADDGPNAQLTVECAKHITPLACKLFNTQYFQIADGKYKVSISLNGIPLDFEVISKFTLTLIAKDRGGLNAMTNVSIDVIDVQDEPPKFLNSPYSITVNESLPPNSAILTLKVRDGDFSPEIRRKIKLEIVDDVKGYFTLSQQNEESWLIQTSSNMIDREDPEILLNGGIYNFGLKATEIVGNSGAGETSFANVTIVIQDINDQEPYFNLKEVDLIIPEDITNGSAIPGLNLIVSDSDTGHNAKFNLLIQDLDHLNPASKAFSVLPSVAIGRTPVIIKVINSNLLDYEIEEKKHFIFNVLAIQDQIQTHATIKLSLSDSNDTPPVFEHSEYHIKIPEDTPPNTAILTLQAHDADSGEFGKISYQLKGFGFKKFIVDPETGTISLAPCMTKSEPINESLSCLDYESQPSYSLSFEAKDGGGRKSSVNLHVEVVDVNDNDPKFVKSIYVRELFEKDQVISPPLTVKATDEDGPSQGGNQAIRYYIKWTNLTGLEVDSVTGDVKLTQPIEANFTLNKETGLRKKLNYEAIVEAVDGGNPPRQSEATILIYVKSERDGEPLFVNEPFTANVKENAPSNSVVIQIKATDPDGPDSKLRYALIDGAKDNFLINSKTGQITVSPGANLDRDLYGDSYSVIITVTDLGHPIPLTSTTTLSITIEDVNNKPPTFAQEAYVIYLSDDKMNPNQEILKIKATDPDFNAKIRYSIDKDHIIARDKTGAILDSFSNNIADYFKIDSMSGLIRINKQIESEKCSMIVVPILAFDINEEDNKPQVAKCELTIFIQTKNSRSPIFNPPWTFANPTYELTINEEALIGSMVFNLAAKNPLNGKPVTEFQKIRETDSDDLFLVDNLSGMVTLNKRIDYEELLVKQLKFSVKAILESEQTLQTYSSVANILVNVEDINDNSPIFSQDTYQTSVLESARWPHTILTVQASDRDSGQYGSIMYSVSGDGSHLFEINPKTGTIGIKNGKILDREIKASYNLQVTAVDNVPQVNKTEKKSLSSTQRKTSVFVKIDLLDVNDNAPKFSNEIYETVIPENVALGLKIGSVVATDPDEGDNGRVSYEFVDFEDLTNIEESLFDVNKGSGEVFVKKFLSGKGRSEPYRLRVRAVDSGKDQLFSDATFLITVGDISANDGVPKIIKPKENEVIWINENTKPGTFVYKVEAIDADSRNTPNGRVMYKFAEPSSYFDIDAVEGVITTSKSLGKYLELDREKQENHTLILIAFDLGSPSQECQRVIFIRLNDTNDNEPYFSQDFDGPTVFRVDEEVPIGSEVARVQAIDHDAGANANIIYEIIEQSEANAFQIETRDNVGYLRSNKRLDRESFEKISLLIKAKNTQKMAPKATIDHSNRNQLRVEIVLNDIDDNDPLFDSENYLTVVRYDADLHSNILTFAASDLDVNAKSTQIEYFIDQVDYHRRDNQIIKNLTNVFDLEKRTGVLKNEISLRSFVGGSFDLIVGARSVSEKYFENSRLSSSFVKAKIFILRDKDFIKFVFKKNPNEVKRKLSSLRENIQNLILKKFGLNLKFNFEGTHFLEKKDGFLDFESSEACFQLIKISDKEKDKILDYKEAIKTLKNDSHELKQIYKKYGIISIEECTKSKSNLNLSSQEMGIIIVAIIIAVFSLILAFVASSIKREFKKKMLSISIVVGPQQQMRTLNGTLRTTNGQPFLKSPSFINISE